MVKTNADETAGLKVLTAEDLELECTAAQVPDAKITWLRSKEGSQQVELKAGDRIAIEGNKLTISKPQEDDAGNYTCRFQTQNVGGAPVEDTIHVVTNVTVRMTGKSINKQEGEDLDITCRAYGKPTPTITWRKNNEDILVGVENATHRLSFSANEDGVPEAQLKLKGLLRPNDAGDYCCKGENVANDAEACIMIRVKDKYGALWPFIGIVAEVILLTAIIYVYEKKKSKPDMEDSDTDQGNNDRTAPKGDVRQRK